MRSPADGTPSYVWAAELAAAGAALVLDVEESRYVAKVCRARAGETIGVTDGRGGLARARVVGLRPLVTVQVEEVEHLATARQALVLSGPPEGERGDWMVEKLAELGVTVFQPAHCARGDWTRTPVRLARWLRLAKAAMRQSRRRFLMEVRGPVSLEQAVASLPSGVAGFLADLDGERCGGIRPQSEGTVAVVVGPSGGLKAAERRLAVEAGLHPISLSDCRLRTETAAVAWASWWASGA